MVQHQVDEGKPQVLKVMRKRRFKQTLRRKKKKKSSAQEDREEKVHTTMEQLKEKHGTVYTPIQLRIWSESIVGGIHSSLEEAPTSSMFAKAGKGPTKKREQSSMSEALIQAALAISTAFSPRAPLSSSSSNQPLGTSPAKEIESCSKCYKQLNELNQLRSSGIITEDEYFEEKESVMCVLRKLKVTDTETNNGSNSMHKHIKLILHRVWRMYPTQSSDVTMPNAIASSALVLC